MLIRFFAALLCMASANFALPAYSALTDPIVFVSRQIPDDGSDFLRLTNTDKAMPGVGARERFRVAAPGKLLVRAANGAIRVLVDGNNPSTASLNLIDVSAPSVSYNATKIVFAGLPKAPVGTDYDRGSHAEPGQWRIFIINADGSGLRQVTRNDTRLDTINMASFLRAGEPYRYDDTDPVWLPDGRIVFSSSRWLTIPEYGHARGTNLHIVNADGSGEHRITSERNGADRPLIDPLTGKIVFARWWLNGRFPSDRMDTIQLADRGGFASYALRDGLTMNGLYASGGQGAVMSNEWIAASVNPDGTDLALWTGSLRVPQFTNNYYGGAFTVDGTLYGNFFPDFPLTESGGFGGIRRYHRGGNGSDPVWGLTTKTDNLIRKEAPQSLTIIHSATGYAADPLPLPDGSLLFAWARNPTTGTEDIGQDYGLFIIDPNNPHNPTLVYDNRGTTELRPQLLRPRPLPPIIHDHILQAPTPTPIAADAQLTRDGSFVFDALNVYANGPVDTPMVNAPPIGSAGTIRFFADYQRAPLNADITLNYPVLLGELPVSVTGAARHTSLPANVSLFEDLRKVDRTLPLTTHDMNFAGGAFVSGMNHGRPGDTVRCMGCHAGHTQIPIPATREEAKWSNLAPGAQVTTSSTAVYGPMRLVNRYAKLEESYEHWRSRDGLSPIGQWVKLLFPVDVNVRAVRLYAPKNGVSVQNVTVSLYASASSSVALAARDSGAVTLTGTNVSFADIPARLVRIDFKSVQGNNASLAEIEVIAAGHDSSTTPPSPSPGGDTTPPTAPKSLLTSLSAQGLPTLSWQASNDGPGVAVTSYTIFRNGVMLAQTTSLSYVDTSAVPGAKYTYSVIAKDAAGNVSAASNLVTLTVPALPSVPTNLRVLLDAQLKPTVSWSPSTAAAGLANYRVFRNDAYLATTTSSSYRDVQVLAGTTYRYQVTAVDRYGKSSVRSTGVSIAIP